MTPQTELHRHLDASFRLSTLLELCQARGLEGQSTTLSAFTERVVLRRPMDDLAQVLDRFTLFQEVFDRPAVLERLALDWGECLAAIRSGLAQAQAHLPEITVGLICIATRDYGPEQAARTAAFYAEHLDAFVGFDLAGNEIGFPSGQFASAVAPLHALADARAR